MTERASATKAVKAREVWTRLFEFFMSTRAQRDRVLERHDLTPNDAKAMSALELGAGRTMGSLAEEWACDASNATWMVDRLEKRGLAQRGSQAGDRRVKLVSLTSKGAQLKKKVQLEMAAPPPEILSLDDEALDALGDALARLSPKAKTAPP
jgi:DNA-binding MarR family transcriptional regulator